MRPVLILATSLALLAGCAAPTKPEGEKPKDPTKVETGLTEVPGSQAYRIAPAIETNHLAVFPIVKITPDDPIQDEAVTLTEALNLGWIKVTEIGNGTVDTLLVTNLGDKPVLLLAGELLLGGKQDRVVAQDTLIPPKSQIKVPARCVEHGRWTDGKTDFKPTSSQVPMSVREAAVFGDQQGVWDNVEKYNAKAGYSGDVSSVRAGIEKSKATIDYEKSVQDFMSKLNDREDVVGIVVVFGGQIQSCELFGSNALFKNSAPSILNGALAEAQHSPGGQIVGADEAAAFLYGIVSGKRLNQGQVNGTSQVMMESEAQEGREIGGGAYAAAPAKDGSLNLYHGTYRNRR